MEQPRNVPGRQQGGGSAAGAPAEAALKFPLEFWGAFAEEYRNLRTRIDHLFGEERKKILMVTSAAPREGKTMLAMNLARAMAELSWRTLLVDGDMRAPTVHHHFRSKDHCGLTDVLKARRLEEGIIRPTDVSNLEVILAGSFTDGTSQMVNSSFLPVLMKELRQRYDYVVLDAPPLMPIADSLILSRLVDGILMVVDARSTPREMVKTAIEQIHDRPLLGLVLNGVKHSLRYYGYY